jgi:hypothetical protein
MLLAQHLSKCGFLPRGAPLQSCASVMRRMRASCPCRRHLARFRKIFFVTKGATVNDEVFGTNSLFWILLAI